MSSESLARLAHAGQLKAEPPSRREFQGLLKPYQGVSMIDEKLLAELHKTAEIVLTKVAALPAPK